MPSLKPTQWHYDRSNWSTEGPLMLAHVLLPSKMDRMRLIIQLPPMVNMIQTYIQTFCQVWNQIRSTQMRQFWPLNGPLGLAQALAYTYDGPNVTDCPIVSRIQAYDKNGRYFQRMGHLSWHKSQSRAKMDQMWQILQLSLIVNSIQAFSKNGLNVVPSLTPTASHLNVSNQSPEWATRVGTFPVSF